MTTTEDWLLDDGLPVYAGPLVSVSLGSARRWLQTVTAKPDPEGFTPRVVFRRTETRTFRTVEELDNYLRKS